MASIPDPMILEFFLRLPVKSLERFKCINKFGYSLISDPDFIYDHLKRAERKNNQCLILSCMSYHNLHSTIQFFTIKDNELAVLEYSVPVSFDSYHVLSSCNGLVCFYGAYGGVHVCNPGTKKSMTLPDSDSTSSRLLSCGFGFGQRTCTYKVIKISDPIGSDVSIANDFMIELLTVGADSWRTIRYQSHFRFLNRQPPVFASGFFYWITARSYGSSGFMIVSFDINNEVFGVVYPPESISRKNWHLFCLVELGGELCLVDLDFELENKRRMDIWLFKDIVNGDHNKDQWVQETIVHPSEPLDATRPVALLGGEILVYGFIKGLDYLNWYNPQTRCFRPVKIKGIPSPYFHVSANVESLVPFNNSDEFV